MAVLQAKKIQESLAKARQVGKVEEPVTIGGCSLVLTNLDPEAYEAINEETSDLEDVAYLHAYQLGHLARAIVEIEGIDLRGVDLVEVEEPTPDGGVKSVKIEKHVWLRDQFLKSWGREAIVVAWRKFTEVLLVADTRAKEGIVFSIEDETDEDRFRRLLNEMQEAAAELPQELVQNALSEAGYLVKTSKEEVEEAGKKLSDISSGQSEEPAEPSQQEKPESKPDQDVASAMANRVPLNRGAVTVPTPRQTVVTPAVEKVPVPAAIREAAVSPQNLSRAAQIAAIEGEGLPNQPAPIPKVAENPEVVELRRPSIEGREDVASILDKPPVGGINPRFKPARR